MSGADRSLGDAWLAALAARLSEQRLEPEQLVGLQQRLERHQAEVSGQLPELLLRSDTPAEALNQWLADKDLSHWIPQVAGGRAADGWQFETASWNRARGAEPMDPGEILRAHLDGGLDALQAPGVAGDIIGQGLEAAVLAASLRLAISLIRQRSRQLRGEGGSLQEALPQALADAGLAAGNGACLSLVISLTLALVPGGQAWLLGGAVFSLSRRLPGAGERAFDLRHWIRAA